MAEPIRYTREMIDEYRKNGYWGDLMAVDLWEKNAREFPDEEAIVDSKVRLTWGQAVQQINRVALGLVELGIERDQVVLAQLPNWVESYILSLACEKAGILCATPPTTLRSREIEYVLKNSGATAVVVPGEFKRFNYLEMIQQLRHSLPKLKLVLVVRSTAPEGVISFNELLEQPLEKKYPADYLNNRKFRSTETAKIYFTTGSTGMPKLVEILASTQLCIGKGLVERFKLTSEDIVAAFSPITGGPGQTITYWAAPQVRAKIAFVESFESGQILPLIEKEGITVAGTVPTILSRMANDPLLSKYDCSSLRAILSGGSPLPYNVALDLEKKMGCRIVNEYGAFDIGNICQSSVDDSPKIRLLTVGKPHPGLEIKLVDENGRIVSKGRTGEIIVRGPVCMGGYYMNSEATWSTWTRDGWASTGDLGKWDRQGNLVIVGRAKDMIIRGGQNIYPQEVEELLMHHPKVLTVAIVGMPDAEMGEKCCAYLVLKSGAEFTFDEMKDFLKEKGVANYKIPERLEVVESLPMVGGQKVDKKALRMDVVKRMKKEKQRS